MERCVCTKGSVVLQHAGYGVVGPENVLRMTMAGPAGISVIFIVSSTSEISRGMLEFRADPESQFHDPVFQKDKTVLLHCGSGGRAALAGKTLQDMGYTAVFNIGGFKDLAEAGIDTEPP